MPLPVLPTSGPVKQALTQKLRANNAIAAAAVGGIHEGLNASKRLEYPYVVFSLAFAPYEHTWDTALFVVGFDIVVRGPDPVKVNNLDALITAELHDSTLVVTGLDTLTVLRTAELPLSPERSAEGRRVFQNGGTYEVWLNQVRQS